MSKRPCSLPRSGSCLGIASLQCFVAIIVLTGCTPDSKNYVSVHAPTAPNPVVASYTDSLSSAEIEGLLDTRSNDAYRLGSSDVISVTVYDHPELDVPPVPGGGNLTGALITSDGSVQLPLIGEVNLAGLTLSDAQRVLTHAYAQYILAPRLSITLMQAQSLRYYLLGEFSAPGVKYPLQPLHLLDALALGGSVSMEQADMYQAYVAHGSSKLPIDLHALLIDGDLSQNVILASGDAIVVPSAINENAFVFGAVSKPGAVSFPGGSLSLLQALAAAGMDLSTYTDARLSRVHIIRSGARSAQYFIVDATRILQGYDQPFALVPGDIVFVPPTALATWNQVLSLLTPSMVSASDSLEPFVQIKYLR